MVQDELFYDLEDRVASFGAKLAKLEARGEQIFKEIDESRKIQVDLIHRVTALEVCAQGMTALQQRVERIAQRMSEVDIELAALKADYIAVKQHLGMWEKI